MSHTAKDWAKLLLVNAEKYYPDAEIPNLKLQYLMYLFQREYIKRFDKQAFFERIEAWDFGPCVPNVFYTYCGFGGMPIQLRYTRISDAYGKSSDNHDLTFPEVNCMMDVLERFACMAVWKLQDYLLSPGSAYQKTLTAYGIARPSNQDAPVIDIWLIQHDKTLLVTDDYSGSREMIPKRDLLMALKAIDADEKVIQLVESWLPEGDHDNG